METKQRMDMKIRLRLGVYKGMEWNDHKGMEWNVFKGKEWRRMELSNFDWMF